MTASWVPKHSISLKFDSELDFTREKKALFEGGVSLIVKPDGLAWQTYKRLSGGQQALAAIALSLAIDAVSPQPSPLLLLDEVDAALDSRAVSRLAELLRSTAGNNRQIFAVTHRPEVIHGPYNSLLSLVSSSMKLLVITLLFWLEHTREEETLKSAL